MIKKLFKISNYAREQELCVKNIPSVITLMLAYSMVILCYYLVCKYRIEYPDIKDFSIRNIGVAIADLVYNRKTEVSTQFMIAFCETVFIIPLLYIVIWSIGNPRSYLSYCEMNAVSREECLGIYVLKALLEVAFEAILMFGILSIVNMYLNINTPLKIYVIAGVKCAYIFLILRIYMAMEKYRYGKSEDLVVVLNLLSLVFTAFMLIGIIGTLGQSRANNFMDLLVKYNSHILLVYYIVSMCVFIRICRHGTLK